MIPLILIRNSFPVLTEKICIFRKKFHICLRFLKNLRGRLHRLHGNSTLPPFAPDARLKYHCALHGSSPDRVQLRSSQPGFSLNAFHRKRKLRFGVVSAYRCAGSTYKECTQAFDIQLSRFQTSLHFPIGHFLWIFQKFFVFLPAGEKHLLLIRTKTAVLVTLI